MDTKILGNWGERLAVGYLVKHGFKIVDRNYKIKYGEIDIIARKGKTIHFVEVKTIIEKSGFFPEQRVDYKKQRKLQNLCQIWLNNRQLYDIPYQIDIIGISIHPVTQEPKVYYIENAVAGG